MRNPMWIPKAIIAVILLVFVGWGGFWVVASRTAGGAFSGWFEDRRAEGWTAEYDALDVAGFPNRLDTTVTGLNVYDPETMVGWEAPIVQLLALVYRPNQVIAVFPGEQTYKSPRADHLITTEDFRASALVKPERSLPLDHANVVASGAKITSTRGWETEAEEVKLFLRETPEGDENQYDMALNVQGFRPDAAFLRQIQGSGVVADVMEDLEIRAAVTFDAPWDRAALETRRPQPREIELTAFAASWGKLELSLTGDLSVDGRGVLEGKVKLKARNWQQIIDIAEATGALNGLMATMAERAARSLAEASGDPDTLDVSLTFDAGQMSLGPIPLGPAPVFVIP
ncbi:DUF2125 domain-containing protein [uncultured Maritimibacter sp.]|jgi:hypothetical protein|uniref:DUF2125 domain-containing protein n=1 Tax=uncultured Maritimibacter sp. TaxID=991866 RepID=UPI000A9C2410|nr:DUF2125 domain-containing protein [uncultured Maritimibacter sp.]